MSLHADLLDQAEQLAKLDPRRPNRQTSGAPCRRPDTLFHLLASATSALYASEAGLSSRIIRGLGGLE